MTEQEFTYLASKVSDGQASDEELMRYSNYFDQLQSQLSLNEIDSDLKSLKAKSWGSIHATIVPGNRWIKMRPLKYVAIAALITVVGAFIFILFRQKNQSNDIGPGRLGATLILSNGSRILLEGSKHGLKVGNDLKYDDGTILDFTDKKAIVEQQYLTVSTSRGQTYRVTLKDGTDVWLNADSKITFPSSFSGNEHVIKLSGEAYFIVKHDIGRKFIVQTDKQQVQDIGTAFNIKSYPDQLNTQTAITQGAVRISSAGKSTGVVTAGNRATLINGHFLIDKIDVSKSIDWKNGEFIFTSEPLGSLMDRIARWYDIQVIFEDPAIINKKFSGSVSRYANISKVIEILESTGEFKVKIEGKKVFINK